MVSARRLWTKKRSLEGESINMRGCSVLATQITGEKKKKILCVTQHKEPEGGLWSILSEYRRAIKAEASQ